MALPKWQARQSLALPNINPNAALNTALGAFDSISDNLAAREAQKAERVYRNGLLQQKAAEFEYEKGEDERAKKRVADMAQVFRDRYDKGVSVQKDNFRVDDNNVATLSAELGIPEDEARAKAREFVTSDPILFVNPSQLEADLVGQMAEEGFMGDEVNTLLQNRLQSSGFSRMNPETQKLMLDSLQKPLQANDLFSKVGAGSADNKSSNGRSSAEIATSKFQDRKKYVDDRLSELFDKGSPGLLQYAADALPFNDPDVYVNDAKAAISDIERAKGIPSVFILDAIESMLSDDTLPFRLSGDMQKGNAAQKAGFDNIANLARQKQFDAYGGNIPGNSTNHSSGITASSANARIAASQSNYPDSVNAIISAGYYQTVTPADRLEAMREAFGLTKKEAKQVDTKLVEQSQNQEPKDNEVSNLLNSALPETSNKPEQTVQKVVEEVTGEKPKPESKEKTNMLMEILLGKKSDEEVPGSLRHDIIKPAGDFLKSLAGRVSNSEPVSRFRIAQEFENENGRYPTEEELQVLLSQ